MVYNQIFGFGKNYESYIMNKEYCNISKSISKQIGKLSSILHYVQY